jgi:alpha-glucosidase
MNTQNRLLLVALLLSSLSVPAATLTATGLASPNGAVRLKTSLDQGRLNFSVTYKNQPVIETSPMQFTMDGVDLTQGLKAGAVEPYQIQETYPWYGVHSSATNHCNGAKFSFTHEKSKTAYTLDVRVFNDAAAFRFILPGANESRVPDEATLFTIPAGSTVWHHDLRGHYEGVHTNNTAAQITQGQWIAPPMTFKLPNGTGYGAITEADLKNYAGMAMQADGHRGFQVRLGHSHPASYPYVLRYGTNEAKRLSAPAAILGTITTPWRVVMIAPDLNGLVNCDVVHNLCPPPDPKLFPKGLKTDWIKPGRAVWKYLDGGGDGTLETMKEFTRLAADLGFEHNILEGFWSRWSDADIKQLVAYAKQRHVGIWFWKHSKSLRDPTPRREFFQRCHDLGVTGAKIDFFDHEAKETIDLYQSCLREAAEQKLLLDFHGANKPTGESRTWPNELTREAVKGMEASKLSDRATHGTTLPFTRLLAGPAEYTPVIFGERRAHTTWAHQIASAAILSTPLLTYAANPSKMVTNPCVAMIKSIPSTWDETIVLPPSEIGECAIFARRHGTTWFLAIMNGTTARKVAIPLSFLGKGDYNPSLVRDNQDGTANETALDAPLRSNNTLTIDLHSGGGFVARFSR